MAVVDCRHCLHFHPHSQVLRDLGLRDRPECRHPLSDHHRGKRDPVTGKALTPLYRSCISQRTLRHNSCGLTGRWFEPREGAA